MPIVWRIVPPHRVADAFTGEGARLFGGRWNSPGVPMVYTAESKALAALEILVHVNEGELLNEYLCIPVTFEKQNFQTLEFSDLPDGWRKNPPPVSVQKLGTVWAAGKCSPVLKVPSVLISGESNYLINPQHRDFGLLKLGPPQPFEFDPRLLK